MELIKRQTVICWANYSMASTLFDAMLAKTHTHPQRNLVCQVNRVMGVCFSQNNTNFCTWEGNIFTFLFQFLLWTVKTRCHLIIEAKAIRNEKAQQIKESGQTVYAVCLAAYLQWDIGSKTTIATAVAAAACLLLIEIDAVNRLHYRIIRHLLNSFNPFPE